MNGKWPVYTRTCDRRSGVSGEQARDVDVRLDVGGAEVQSRPRHG